MQEAGLLTREPTDSDRRMLRVSLTDSGRALRGPLEAMWATLEHVTVRDLDAGAAAAFMDAAASIQSAVEAREGRSR